MCHEVWKLDLRWLSGGEDGDNIDSADDNAGGDGDGVVHQVDLRHQDAGESQMRSNVRPKSETQRVRISLSIFGHENFVKRMSCNQETLIYRAPR